MKPTMYGVERIREWIFLTCAPFLETMTAVSPQGHGHSSSSNNSHCAAKIRKDSHFSTISFKSSVQETTDVNAPEKRFDRTAPKNKKLDTECVVIIEGTRYNMTSWAKAHPGGVNVLKAFHGKDATKAFHAASHSKKAHKMLPGFAMDKRRGMGVVQLKKSKVPRWKQKLFTKEGENEFVFQYRIGLHKYLGVFVLANFAYRYVQMYFGDPSAGLGTRMGKGPGLGSALCLIPHGCLSLSSLIFHNIPRERVVGKPMIWQEYRVHNIIFGLRSVICSLLAWLSYYKDHAPPYRTLALVGSCVAVLVSNWTADVATERLRPNDFDSTTATTPYWEGCSLETQKRFKSFYAYCQFMATLVCMAVCNPAFGLAVLLAIQMASLLLTLVRKGLVSAKGYHVAYTTSLLMAWVVGFRSMYITTSADFIFMMGIGWAFFQLRRRGVNKYLLWVPLCLARVTVGDQLLHWDVW